MLRNKYLVTLVSLLFVAVVVYNITFFLKRFRSPNLKAPELPVARTEVTSKEGKSLFPVTKDKSQWRRDPFIHEAEKPKGKKFPLNNKTDSNVKIVLQGIMISKGKFYALVNGWVVKKGDRFEGMLVEDVSRDSILLRTENKLERIKLE